MILCWSSSMPITPSCIFIQMAAVLAETLEASFARGLAASQVCTGTALAIALSGGADSVALTKLAANWATKGQSPRFSSRGRPKSRPTCNECALIDCEATPIRHSDHHHFAHWSLIKLILNPSSIWSSREGGNWKPHLLCRREAHIFCFAAPHPVALVVDHNLRPDSAQEAAQACSVAQSLGLPAKVITLGSSNGWPPAKRGELLSLARKHRYQALHQECATRNIPVILTAHHAGAWFQPMQLFHQALLL